MSLEIRKYTNLSQHVRFPSYDDKLGERQVDADNLFRTAGMSWMELLVYFSPFRFSKSVEATIETLYSCTNR